MAGLAGLLSHFLLSTNTVHEYTMCTMHNIPSRPELLLKRPVCINQPEAVQQRNGLIKVQSVLSQLLYPFVIRGVYMSKEFEPHVLSIKI